MSPTLFIADSELFRPLPFSRHRRKENGAIEERRSRLPESHAGRHRDRSCRSLAPVATGMHADEKSRHCKRETIQPEARNALASRTAARRRCEGGKAAATLHRDDRAIEWLVQHVTPGLCCYLNSPELSLVRFFTQ